MKVLVTSRARLQLAAERIVELPRSQYRPTSPTAVTPPFCSSRWHRSRSRKVPPRGPRRRRRLDLSQRGRAAVGHRAGGRHVRTLPPSLLRTRLAGAARHARRRCLHGAPERQQTIPATIDWSLQLLRRTTNASSPASASSRRRCPSRPSRRCAQPGTDVVEGLASLSTTAWCAGREPPASRGTACSSCCCRSRRALLVETELDATARGGTPTSSLQFLDDLDERRWGSRLRHLVGPRLGTAARDHANHDWSVGDGDVATSVRITADLGTFWHRDGHAGRGWVAGTPVHEDAVSCPSRSPSPGGGLRRVGDGRARGPPPVGSRAIDIFRGLGDDRYLSYALGLSAGLPRAPRTPRSARWRCAMRAARWPVSSASRPSSPRR